MREPSLGIRLLSDLRKVFDGKDKMATKAILASLIALDKSPWGDLRGKPLDERGLAHRLKAYGIKSTLVRLSDGVARGYKREDLFDAWQRYVPAPQADNGVTGVTSVSDEPLARLHVTPVTSVTHLSGQAGEWEAT